MLKDIPKATCLSRICRCMSCFKNVFLSKTKSFDVPNLKAVHKAFLVLIDLGFVHRCPHAPYTVHLFVKCDAPLDKIRKADATYILGLKYVHFMEPWSIIMKPRPNEYGSLLKKWWSTRNYQLNMYT